MSSDFNGWRLDDAKTLAQVKYLAVMRGDLDLTNAYGLESDEALTEFLIDKDDRLYCVFEVARLVS
jgi:hypothetical protein